jgi:hypothetical protein
MSNSAFVKGECRHCAGHLEFPANAAGQTVSCPHCGQPTELVAAVLPDKTRGSGRIWLGVGVGACLAAAGLAGGVLYLQKAVKGGGSVTNPLPVTQSNTLTQIVAPKPRQILTNDYAILPFKLEKTTNSSLVYVTGTIRNMSENQRFGVKVEFGLFDTNDNAVGSATDYQQVLEPHGEWRFKALVISSKAVSARFNSIAEEK